MSQTTAATPTPVPAGKPDRGGTPAPARPQIHPVRLILGGVVLLTVMVLWGLMMRGTIMAEMVISSSMEPTIDKGDRIIVVEMGSGDPIERGDIVMVSPQEGDNLPLLKRVVGLPGDTIVFVENQVWVNESPSREDLVRYGLQDRRYSYRKDLTDNEYFVLGDNRDNSYDSLSFGPVAREELIGEAVFRYWPLDKIGFLDDDQRSN